MPATGGAHMKLSGPRGLSRLGHRGRIRMHWPVASSSNGCLTAAFLGHWLVLSGVDVQLWPRAVSPRPPSMMGGHGGLLARGGRRARDGQLLPGEEHVRVVAAVREQEVGHAVAVIAPGEVVARSVADIGDVVAHVAEGDDRVEL